MRDTATLAQGDPIAQVKGKGQYLDWIIGWICDAVRHHDAELEHDDFAQQVAEEPAIGAYVDSSKLYPITGDYFCCMRGESDFEILL
jgi:hypothetical protein